MAQVDSENSTAVPARPGGAVHSPGLARQQRDREKALRRIAKLRERAADEIDRLLAFLDACDPYAATELERQVDDGPCDTDELEQDLSHYSAVMHEDWDGSGQLEADGCDDEPSLGSRDEETDQTGWVAFVDTSPVTSDREVQCDDEGVS